MTSPGVVYVDETVDEYRDIRLPKNWKIHYEPEWGSLQASLQWCFENYPDATHYGWLADDVRPRTPDWDKRLEAAAGDWYLSYARDLWFSESEGELLNLENGDNLSSGLCWGGDLVRTVGWWALPGVRQAFIDVAWCRIISPFGLQRYMHDVTVEHLNYKTGKREMDAVDDWSRNGDNYIERDIDMGWKWLGSSEFIDVMGRIFSAPGRPGPSERQMQLLTERTIQNYRDGYVNDHWKPGMSAARLANFVRDFDRGADIERITKVLHSNADKRSTGVAWTLS